MLRDFTSVLSVLLDSGVPEAEALNLAGEAADNLVLKGRAARAREMIASGIPLNDAFVAIDGSGELNWRLRNAIRSGNQFSASLGGWHQVLDARAFQHEQTAAQLFTTFLVLFNGAIVGSIALGFFLVLATLMYDATLW